MAQDWRVTSQRQSEQLNPGGTGFQTVMVVTYEVINGPAIGVTGSVSVPKSVYNAVTVAEMIQHDVDTHHEVASI